MSQSECVVQLQRQKNSSISFQKQLEKRLQNYILLTNGNEKLVGEKKKRTE